METTTPRHPESVWDSHKSEIERLYCDENWSQKAVHEFMREMHGFCATKFQYESHFKKWKFRKNHSQATWAKIGDLVRQGGSSSVVKHNGRELSARKLQKGITRYKTGDTSTAANDPLSPGFELVLTDVSKPPPMRAQLSLVYVTPSISLMRLFSIRNDFLPHPRGTQNKFPGTITILDIEFTKDLTYELPELAKSHHPSINLRAILPLSTLGSSEAAPDGTTSPASQAQDISLARGYSVELHVLIHALSNNMTSRLGFQNLGQVWRCVRNNHSLGTQEVLTYTLRSTYSKDLCHTIVQAAIEAGDAAGVRQLIRMWSINVDDVTCYGTNREAFSAVELAAGLVHSDVLAVLLDEGADINKTGAYSSRKLGKATGGAIYWLVYSAELTGLFHTPSTDSDQCSETSPKYVFRDSSSWTENALGVIQHLASTQVCHPALVEALRQNIYIAPFFETAWTAEELGQLYSHTKNTHLFWLFKKSVIMSIRNNQEHNLDVVKWCVPATTTEQAANKKPPLVDPSALLRRTVMQSSRAASIYLVARGIELTTPGERCTYGSGSNHTLGGCLLEILSASPAVVPPPQEPTRPCKHAELLTRLCGTINLGRTQDVLDALENEMKCNPKLFWVTLISRSRGSDRHAQSGEDKLLLAALAQKNRPIVERLLEIRQGPLRIDQPMVTAAWLGRDLELHSLLIGAALSLRIYPKTWDQIFNSPDVALLECLVAHSLEVNDYYDEDDRYFGNDECLQKICLKGGSRLVQYYLDLTRQRPFFSDESLSKLTLDNNVFDTLLNYTPRRGWAHHTKFIHIYILHAVGRGDCEFLRKILDQNTVIDIHNQSQVELDEDYESKHDNKSLLGGLILDYNPQNDEAFQLVLQECCKSSKIDHFAAWDEDLFDTWAIPRVDARCAVLTPLLLATRQGFLHLVQILVLRYKAKIDLPATGGRRRTPLQAAAEHGHYDIVKWLIDNGAAVNEPINQRAGATSLQLAALGGFCGIMELLINKGADLNAPGAVIHGRTALEGAAEHGRLDAVKLLLDSGVSMIGDGEQSLRRARRRARDNGYASIVELLDDSWQVYRSQSVWFSGLNQVDGSLSDEEVLLDGDLDGNRMSPYTRSVCC